MKTRKSLVPTVVFPIILTLALGFILQSSAEAAIAKISKFTGEVIVQSGEQLKRVKIAGTPLDDGDRILTKQGNAEILFSDGAIMRVNPFSNAMVQEMQEQGGFWIFKTRVDVRRITCLVGKLFFQSGAPGKKNYLQTPTAVAGIRGSSGDVGFDNINSYLHMFVGEAAVVGSVIRGLFRNPGINAAQKNAVYRALSNAYDGVQKASATGRAVAVAEANVKAVEVGKLVAEILGKNPDPVVQANANLIAETVDAVLSSANAKVSVERIKEDQAEAEQAAAAASQSGDAQKAKQAELAARKAEQDRIAAEEAAAQAKAAAERAAAALAANDLAEAQKAAKDAANAEAKAKTQELSTQKTVQDVVTTTETTAGPTTVSEDKGKKDKDAATTAGPTTVQDDKGKKDKDATSTTATPTTVQDDKGKKDKDSTTTAGPTTVQNDKGKKDKGSTTIWTTTSTVVTTTIYTTVPKDKDKKDKKTTTSETTIVKPPSP